MDALQPIRSSWCHPCPPDQQAHPCRPRTVVGGGRAQPGTQPDAAADDATSSQHSLPANHVCLQLILRSINPAKSAFLALNFECSFFSTYNVYGGAMVQAGVLIKVSRVAGREARGLVAF
jgi:hypothetical protein